MPSLPGEGGQDGLLAYMIAHLVQMPYLWLIWVIVLSTCLIFTSLDRKKAVGIPQGIYAGSLIVVLLLRGAEMHSFGYYTIWVLGTGGLATYWGLKLARETMVV